MNDDNLLTRIGATLTKYGGGKTATDLMERLEKLNTKAGLSHSTGFGQLNKPEPPYQRIFSPLWIYKIRRDSSVVNNAMRQKIWQTFRGGLSEWEKEYDAKCPACREEFQGVDAFRQQMETDTSAEGPDDPMEGGGMMDGDPMADGGMMGGLMGGEGEEEVDPADFDEEDIDLDTPRTCPECEEYVEMLTPNPEVKHNAQSYFDRANAREQNTPVSLEPTEESAVSQSFVDVLEEIAWDIQSFDDGWLLFERSYQIDDDGVIYGYDLENVYRGPPELMRWSIDEDENEPGGDYWVCVECRAADPEYEAEEEDVRCSECGNVTYPALAFATGTPAGQGGRPEEYFIRGEFYHDAEYERKRWYGYPPVLTLWEESRTLEQMDGWYSDAYEERRAPRGALLVNAAHDAELRELNRQQMEKMREDPNYIPLFMNDNEEEGDPIKFVELLSDPAEMQHMEMREWFIDRIGAHFGVTAVLMDGSADDSGLSQSMEVEVSEKQAEHFRDVLNGYIDAFLAQIGTEGWTRELTPVEEENQEHEAQLVGQHLNNAQKALGMGAEVEWTDDDRADIKQGELEAPEDDAMIGGEGGMGGPMDGGMMGGMDDMGMEGGVQDDRGPEPHSLEPGDSPNEPQPDADRERQGPADEDRPAATPLKAALNGEPGDERLEKIATAVFDTPSNGLDNGTGEVRAGD